MSSGNPGHNLIEKLSSRDDLIARESIESLVNIGDPAIPQLVASLDQTRRFSTMRIIQVLEELGPSGIEALKRRYATCKDDTLRVTIGIELARITRDPNLAPDVAAFLTSERSLARAKAASWVGELMDIPIPVTVTVEEGGVFLKEFSQWWQLHGSQVIWYPILRFFRVKEIKKKSLSLH